MWTCTHHNSKFCPGEGCPAFYGCAIDRGWSQGQLSPPECQGFPSDRWRWKPRWLVAYIAGFTLRWSPSRASVFRHGWSSADIHPVAWFIIVAVVSFVVGALVF